jgi:hypothetical protein
MATRRSSARLVSAVAALAVLSLVAAQPASVRAAAPAVPVVVNPSLSFICLLPDGATVTTCRLIGRGFRPDETVRIVYDVRLDPGSHNPARTLYRRTVTTDARGSFARPPLRVALNNRTLTIEVTATGARGEHATATVAGPA